MGRIFIYNLPEHAVNDNERIVENGYEKR